MNVPTDTAASTSATATPSSGTSRTHVLACVTWVAILIVVMVGKVSEWVPGLHSLPLAKITFLLAAISAFRSQGVLASVRVRSLRIARPALAFMVLAILSVTFSVYKSNSLIASEVIVILMLAMLLLLKVTQTHQDIERLLTGLAAAGASLTLGLLLNYHGGRADINDNFDPNEIAYALDTLLPIVLALRAMESRLKRLLMSALALMMVASILLTGSRGGSIGLFVVLLAVITFPLSRDGNGDLKRFSLGRTLIRCVILIAAAAFAWNYLPAETQKRMATLVDLGSDYNSDPNLNASRMVIWRRDVNLALERPIGYGLDSAEIVDGLHGGQYRTAHNSLVQAFVELGVLGLVLYLYSYFSAWRYLGRVSAGGRQPSADEQARKAALYARALRVALAGNLAAGFFLSLAYAAALWMLLAIAAALVRIATPESPTTASDEPLQGGAN
jgi:O-antigen ligase